MLPVGYEKMTPVQVALFAARFRLSQMHGSTLVNPDNIDEKIFNVDNTKEIDLIDKATAWLGTPAGKGSCP